MNSKKRKDLAWIGAVCVILGILMALQFKTVQKTYLQGQSPTQKSSQMVAELTKLKNEKEVLMTELETIESKLKEIESTESKGNVVIRNLNNEMNKYKAFSGLLDVYGQGLEIVIDNPPKEMTSTFESNIAYDYEVILSLINELNAAGAEAISINDQRILSSTEIRTAGESINVNKIPQSAPFTIKAIGNVDTLEGALIGRFGIATIIQEKSYQLEIKKMEKVTIPKYKGIIDFRYSTISEE